MGSDTYLQLLDSFDNEHRGGLGGTAEALYVGSLTLLAGSTLDLNGLHLYCQGLDDQGAAILNGLLINLMPGDVNGDWFVASDDLVTVLTWWGRTGMDRQHGDLTGEGFVGVDDYVEVLTYWGTGTPPEPTPEPGTLGLLLMGGAILLRRKLELRGERRKGNEKVDNSSSNSLDVAGL